MNSAVKKLDLYIISLALLFVFFFIMTIDVPICWGDSCKFIGVKALMMTNIVPMISVVALFYCLFAYKKFGFDIKASPELPFEIKKLEGINYEHLTFLATYVVPLISFDFGSGRQMIILALLLIVMGIIYIKTDLFYANPSLALLGFHIYKADGDFKGGKSRDGIILISQSKLDEKQKVSYLKLDDRIYYVRGCE